MIFIFEETIKTSRKNTKSIIAVAAWYINIIIYLIRKLFLFSTITTSKKHNQVISQNQLIDYHNIYVIQYSY